MSVRQDRLVEHSARLVRALEILVGVVELDEPNADIVEGLKRSLPKLTEFAALLHEDIKNAG